MNRFSGKEICKILESFGFELVRQKGSHAIMQKKEMETTTTIPVLLHKELKEGTLRSIIRQAGLDGNLFR
jgi:predicted RNA binding protein YcfA (HicA-like mRNA interferase family)